MESTIECPWCGERMDKDSDVCPSCMHEVLPQHLAAEGIDMEGEGRRELEEHDLVEDGGRLQEDYEPGIQELEHMSLEEMITSSYRCSRCGGRDCSVNETASNGTGISRLLDFDYIQLMFSSCQDCSHVEWYDSEIMRQKSPEQLQRLLIKLFPKR